MRTRPVAAHQIKLRGLMALQSVVKARIGNPFSIGRNGGGIVRSFAIGERAQSAIGDAEFVHFRVEVRVVRFRMAICRNDQILAVGGPFRVCRCPLISAIRKIPVRNLPRCAAISADHEHLHVPRLQVARAVEAIHKTVISRRWIRPLRSLGWFRQVG